MRFSGVESRADDQERILEMSLVQNWWFMTGPVAERAAAPACEGWLMIDYGVGGR